MNTDSVLFYEDQGLLQGYLRCFSSMIYLGSRYRACPLKGAIYLSGMFCFEDLFFMQKSILLKDKVSFNIKHRL